MRGEFHQAAADCIRTRQAGIAIDRIVIHCMDGTLPGTMSWFKTAGRPVPTAAHFLVGRVGTVVQMVLERDKAIHAGSPVEGGWNDRSIGIELEARLTPWPKGHSMPFPVDEFPEPMLSAAAALVADICTRRGIPADRTHIVGHCEVPGVTHTDPGARFPWADFMARIGRFTAKE